MTPEWTPLHALIGAPELVAELVRQLHLDPETCWIYPEAGIHPYDVPAHVDTIRTIADLWAEGPGVVLITLSPLVINELAGHEVSVVTQSEKGQLVVTRLDRTPHYEDRRKVYENGELWLANPDVEGRQVPTGGSHG